MNWEQTCTFLHPNSTVYVSLGPNLTKSVEKIRCQMVPFVVLMPNIIFARPSAEAEGLFGFFLNFLFAPIIKYVRYDPWRHQKKYYPNCNVRN
jgi:hypothetical protein